MYSDLAYISVQIDSLSASVDLLQEKRDKVDDYNRKTDLQNENMKIQLNEMDEAFVKRVFAGIQRDKPPRIQDAVDKTKFQIHENNAQHQKLQAEVQKQTDIIFDVILLKEQLKNRTAEYEEVVDENEVFEAELDHVTKKNNELEFEKDSRL